MLLGGLLLAGCKARQGAEPMRADSLASVAADSVVTVTAPVHAASITTLKEAVVYYKTAKAPTDLAQAVAIFQKNSYANDAVAQYYLGDAHLRGIAVEGSELEAYVWWTISARNGNQMAKQKLVGIQKLFSKTDLQEIDNRANDWVEKYRNFEY